MSNPAERGQQGKDAPPGNTPEYFVYQAPEGSNNFYGPTEHKFEILNRELFILSSTLTADPQIQEGGKTFQEYASEINKKALNGLAYSLRDFLNIPDGSYREVENILGTIYTGTLGGDKATLLVSGIELTPNDVVLHVVTPDGTSILPVSILMVTNTLYPPKSKGKNPEERTSLFKEGVTEEVVRARLNEEVTASFYSEKDKALESFRKFNKRDREDVLSDHDGRTFIGIENIDGQWYAVMLNMFDIYTPVSPQAGWGQYEAFSLSGLKARKAFFEENRQASAETERAIEALEEEVERS